MTFPLDFAPSEHVDLYSVATGALHPLDDVPDEMFAERMLGDGFAVAPADGAFRAPIAGELVVLSTTLHAYAIRSDSGVEVLVHIGIDTVELAGEGFTARRSVGDRVQVGDEVVRCDLDRVAARVPSMLTPVIVTNGELFEVTGIDLAAGPGEPIARIIRRS
jgi:glucose-specific phosphotransferase system IIA component